MNDQKRTFLAIALSALVIFAWQYYFTSTTPASSESASKQTVSKDIDTTMIPVKDDSSKSPLPAEEAVAGASLVVSDFVVAGDRVNFLFASDFSILRVDGREDPKQTFSEIVVSKNPFLRISVIEGDKVRPLNLTILSKDNSSYLLTDSSLGVKVSLNFDKKDKLQYVIDSARPYQYQIEMNAKETAENPTQQFSTYLYNGASVERIVIGKDDVESEEPIRWVGIDYNYQLLSMVFVDKISAKVNIAKEGPAIIRLLEAKNNLSGFFVYKRKDYDDLKALGGQLHLAVDFGIFGIVAVPILKGLKFFYKIFPNFGVAIILMTILIKIITFPLQYKSYQSMKKMQQIQPELNKLKEKYKDDAQAIQRETMALFKRAGANPMGGCLPILAQFPVLIAFYKVLSAAVELVNAPFYGWIHDLSVKDPYYIYPIAMTLSMVIQQKFTPQSTTDETQKKIMMFMPFFVGFIMKDLAAGLVIYMFVSTLLGMIQQYWQMKMAD